MCQSQNKMVLLPRPALIYFLSQLFFVTLFCRKKFHNVQFESKWGGKGRGTKKQRISNRINLHNFIHICRTEILRPLSKIKYFWGAFLYVIFRYLRVKLTLCLNFQFLIRFFKGIWMAQFVPCKRAILIWWWDSQNWVQLLKLW